jgi:ribonucleotide reductase alpha subunit
MQAAAQKSTDNAVSKTVHVPEIAGMDDVRAVFDLTWPGQLAAAAKPSSWLSS